MDAKTKEKYLSKLKIELDKLDYVQKENFDSVLQYLNEFDVIGFDIDFTLLIYNKKNIYKLLYESMSKYLIEHQNFPDDILYSKNVDFITKFSYKNTIFDLENGNVIRLAQDTKITKCYHGKKLLDKNEIKKIYPSGKYKSYAKGILYTDKFFVNLDCFQYQNLPLFLLCVDLFDKGQLKKTNVKNYGDIMENIRNAVIFNFFVKDFEDFSTVGYYFPGIFKHPELYIYKYNAENILDLLRKKGKRLFFATNSNFSYANYLLSKAMGKDYQNHFDLCFYKSCKPGFFQDPVEAGSKCFFYDDKKEISCQVLSEEDFNKIKGGDKILTGGNYNLIESYFKKIMGKNDLKCLFVGDNILSDCEVPAKLDDWESLFIDDEINLDFIGENSVNFGEAFKLEDEKNNYSNTFSNYFKEKNCLFALPNVEGFKYIIN